MNIILQALNQRLLIGDGGLIIGLNEIIYVAEVIHAI